ncbi:MAG: DNA-binding response regulator, partial [Roseiflexaceae bacterium]
MPTILLVEDEPTLSETLRYNLEREGYTVLTAGDGVRGLEL